MHRVADFGHFGKHDRSSGPGEKVRRVDDRRVAGDSGEGIAAAALRADDEVRGGANLAAALAQLLEARLSGAQDSGDHFAESPFVLQANDVGVRVEDGQLRKK